MDVTFHKVYMYDNVRQLLAVGDTFCSPKDNGPMNKDIIKVHKGIDNKVIFRALGPDRIPFDVSCGGEVYARIMDSVNRKVILEKLCWLGPAKGIITLTLDAGDITDAAAGLYDMVLIRTERFVSDIPDYYKEQALYSDMNDNVSMQIMITEQALKSPTPSIVFEPKDWTPDLIRNSFNGQGLPCFYTGRIPGARVLNHKDGVHTFSTYTQNFTGKLQLFGTLDETPDPYLDDTRWFKIYTSSMTSDIDYTAYTGTQSWAFEANFMWLKFRLIPSTDVLDSGQFLKLIVRT
jgi:hypothetical protein